MMDTNRHSLMKDGIFERLTRVVPSLSQCKSPHAMSQNVPSSDVSGVRCGRSGQHGHESLPSICFLQRFLRVLNRGTVRQLHVYRLEKRNGILKKLQHAFDRGLSIVRSFAAFRT